MLCWQRIQRAGFTMRGSRAILIVEMAGSQIETRSQVEDFKFEEIHRVKNCLTRWLNAN